ncbi:hypothetical protein ACTOB_001271 [Actinoplanes oblitus]|uniref:DUF2637 domain-containing protein n=1 Tax=Actinoplanes oblitus TaxID=3040509 RepID=A0ABY8WMH3_9ACTN|nr:hypothetical protein [Actinoplanes oblitus]WIM97723.1 hypothetical protein ACTOB_001271 [Actinoplanes oblitus]
MSMPTIVDNVAERGEQVADCPTNGHPTPLAAGVAQPAQAPLDDHGLAKIKEVAERAGDRPQRSLRQVVRDWRIAHRGKARPEHGGTVANGDSWAWSLPIMIGGGVAVFLTAFVLSYHGLYGFGTLAKMPPGFRLGVPVIFDAFSITALIATFFCQAAAWHVRAYCWLMFGLSAAGSIAGNVIYAASLDPSMAARWRPLLDACPLIGGVAWPVVGMAVLHLIIITIRERRGQQSAVAQAAAEVEHQAQADEQLRLRAVELVALGGSCQDVANKLGAPLRNVQRWTKPVRDAQQAAAAKAPATPRSRAKA